MDEAIDSGEGHGFAGEDFAPFTEWLVCRDEQRASFVAGADELEEDAAFGLILGDIGDVVEDEQVEFVEFGDGGFESEVLPSCLQLLHEIGCSRVKRAPSLFDEGAPEGRRTAALSASGWA